MPRLMSVFAINLMASVILLAQQPGPPGFEVASVKPNKSGARGGSLRPQPGGRVDAVNMPVNTLISFAYQAPLFMLTGGPAWIADERFDIVAKLEGDPSRLAGASGLDTLRLAMRSLLADRFQLKVHRETRDGDVYALVMARSGGAP